MFKVGERLVLAAPAHTGLPTGATCIVSKVLSPIDAEAAVRYSVTLVSGGKHGSDVVFVPSVNEGWLRHESRIATAKSCAPLRFGDFTLLARHLLVPIFQRRYCWQEDHWRKLWRDVCSLRSALLGTHAIGRVVVAREPQAVMLVDGQQRCTTLMLLLCAVRDVARETSGAAAEPLVAAVNAVLLTRPSAVSSSRRRLRHAATGSHDGAAEGANAGSSADRGGGGGGGGAHGQQKVAEMAMQQARLGLEDVDGADTVRLIPSLADRLPFCCLVLGLPLERHRASRASSKMGAAYELFRTEARELLRVQVLGAQDTEAALAGAAEGAAEGGVEGAAEGGPERRPGRGVEGEAASSAVAGAAPVERHRAMVVDALKQVVENVLRRVSVVAFELQEGVALQNIYDMLAQRERVLRPNFASYDGLAMADTDLVRNLLLGHIADAAERLQAYEEWWAPMEAAHGDGDAAVLEAFLHSFAEQEHAALAAERGTAAGEGRVAGGGVAGSGMAADGVGTAAPAIIGGFDVLQSYASLLAARGGNMGALSLYAAGTTAADRAAVVDGADAEHAALALLKRMHSRALRTRPVSHFPPALPHGHVDLWSPEAVMARAAGALPPELHAP